MHGWLYPTYPALTKGREITQRSLIILSTNECAVTGRRRSAQKRKVVPVDDFFIFLSACLMGNLFGPTSLDVGDDVR